MPVMCRMAGMRLLQKLSSIAQIRLSIPWKSTRLANGTSAAVSLAVSNGDANAFNARIYGAEYWNPDGSWYVYFNATASVTQLVRVNYILAPII